MLITTSLYISYRAILKANHEFSTQAYVSVIRDTNEATITAPSSGISDLSRHLSNEGVSAIDTGLTGRYHTPNHQRVPEKVLQACKQHGGVRFGKQHVVRSNTDGEILSHDDAVMAVSRDMLLERSNWHLVSSKAALRLVELDGVPFVLALGSDAVPSSMSRNVKVIRTSSERTKDQGSYKTSRKAARISLARDSGHWHVMQVPRG